MADSLIARIEESGVSHIDLQFVDVNGMVKVVQIPAAQIDVALRDGIWFDGSSLEGFARVAESDMYLRPDPSTFAVLPWENAARLICDVVTPTGEPFAGDPRTVLRRAVDLARQMGYQYVVTPELEFFLFPQPVDLHSLRTDDRASYFDASEPKTRMVRRAIVEALESMGIKVESTHHEVGGGQHELDFAPMEALHMADAIMTARVAVKAIAQEHGFLATFMPKPIAGVAGSGMHTHQALIDASNGLNCFSDSDAPYGLSHTGRCFLAGQLAHARGICAVLAPLVNSYKRLVAGLEAPVYVTWAQLNRSALVRVPRTRPHEHVRIELRNIDPSCNPYLAFAVMLRAGLDGISRSLELPEPAEEELYKFNARRRQLTTLPTSLNEALIELETSPLANGALGLNMIERFLEAKRMEWNEYVLDVSPWELQRYLINY
jgi:glutamine synthetase